MVDAGRSRSIERSPGTRTASTPVAVSDVRSRSKKALARSPESGTSIAAGSIATNRSPFVQGSSVW